MINTNSKKINVYCTKKYLKYYKIQFLKLLKYTTKNFNLHSNFGRPEKFKPSLSLTGYPAPQQVSKFW